MTTWAVTSTQLLDAWGLDGGPDQQPDRLGRLHKECIFNPNIVVIRFVLLYGN